MYCIAEITMYPLTENYLDVIREFIEVLNEYDDLDISTGETATLVRGDYDRVMAVLTKEIKQALDGDTRMSFVMKVLNTER